MKLLIIAALVAVVLVILFVGTPLTIGGLGGRPQ